MYLKSIDLYGFKSFAKKTVFKFDEGVTGVVGPNGSGKSNIADAVRWVLGEQSAKMLRGASMQDVIFAGTENRKPLGYCQVDLTIDNHDQKMAIDFSEVTISRRVYRSGESEYFINQTACRLKDVHELFMDTGVGKEGYSIIGQGQIDKILSTKPDDRRALFDEAVGIVKYKKRKLSAEKKLDDEKQNLLRINDIIKELEGQQQGLMEQAEVAKKYIANKEALKKYEVNIFIHEMEKIDQDIHGINENEQILQDQISDILKNKATINEKHIKTIKEIEVLEEEIENKNKLAMNIVVDKEKKESEAKLLKEKIINLSNINERISAQNKALTNRQNINEKENSSHFDAFNLLQQQYAEKSTELTKKQQALNEYASAISESENKIESIKTNIIERLNEIASAKSKILRYTTMGENLDEREKSIKERERLLEANINGIRSDVAFNTKKIDDLSQEQKAVATRKKQKADELREIEEERKKLVEALNGQTAQLNILKSKYQALNDLNSGYEGYNFSIKKIMELKNSNPSMNDRVLGVVADIISVKKEYEVAIETALGGSIQNVVTDNEQTAKELIGYLKKNRFGRCTFLPITSIKARDSYSKLDEKDIGFIGYGSDIVNRESTFDNVIDFLLGSVAIIDTIDHALVIAKKYNYSIRMVTLSGEVINRGGSLTGGEFKNKGNQFLARKSQLEECEKNIYSLKETVKGLQKSYNANDSKYNELAQMMESENKEDQEIRLELNNTAIYLKQQENEYKKYTEEMSEIKIEINQIMEQKNEILNKISELENGLKTVEKENTTDEEMVKALSSDIQGEKGKKEQLIDQLTSLKIETSTLNEKLSNAKENTSRIQKDIEDVKAEIDKNEKEINQNILEINEKNNSINELEEKIKVLATNINDNEMKIKGLYETKNNLTKEQEVLYIEKEKYNDKMSLLEKDLLRLEGTKEKHELKRDSQMEYMWNEYEINPSNALDYKVDDLSSIAEMKKNITTLRNKIKALGDVNVNAIEEFKTVSTRYEFLTAQRDDLVLAEEKLKAVIEELKVKMEKQFREKFKDISIKFNEVFRELFGGGKGILTLTESDNVLEAGIDINAQPPGKKLQRMALLSGGEKAFTAIALLFAIQSLKPSPFCVLDEIEAALDDANVDRFAKYLQKLSNNTQFIIITHRRGTMEAADALYGITMQEKGVSTQVSVKLLEDQLED
jgi:chromosome segregation protein